ncbi:class I SAM-dependent methyltransferase [Halobacterium sp. MBLA0001]|uniref:class I SAM-dependent methyltransferase n=1 Tax=Halobacterium sp. MBLA0001 TaxID=3413511 RepID=UPI003C795F77
MPDDESFNYSSEMRNHYKSDEVAKEYHSAFANKENWRHALIARRERKAIGTLLEKIPNGTIIDIPTGSGKLAPVFAAHGSEVVACDISENMLQIAEQEFEQAGVKQAQFQVSDAEHISEEINENFDVAVCLRLLHRVPAETKQNILKELGSIADYIIASTGVETRFHQLRRGLRQRTIGGDLGDGERGNCYESPQRTEEIFSTGFEIIESKKILPILSQEHIFLLKNNE